MFFSGWQWQPEIPTVQGALQEAFFLLCQERVIVWGSGRTDRGVHALGQVAHVELLKDFPPHILRSAMNFYLRSSGITVVRAFYIPPEFHCRFSAISRSYIYRIFPRDTPSPLEKNRSWWVPYEMNISAMQEAATYFVGTHDFSGFRCARCQASSPVRTLDVLNVTQEKHLILIHTRARSFLHHQVRMMVGALVHVGRGKWEPQHIQKILNAKKSSPEVRTAPPWGLYLEKIEYPPHHTF